MKIFGPKSNGSARDHARRDDQLVELLEARVLMSSTRVAVIGDFSSDVQTTPTRDVASLVNSWSPDAVVTVGDNNYPNGAASTIDANIGQWYSRYIYPYTGKYGSGSGDHANHFWPALGNHDWSTGTDKPYTDYFALPGNERYYTKQVGNVGLFIVDSDPHEPDGTSANSTQGQWLKNALANSTAQWKLVFFHHPAYSSGGIGSNSNMQWPFQQWGATAVFSGHDHDYERIIKNNFPYFVDGLGGESIVGFGSTVSGSQVRYDGNYGAMKVDATDSAITFQFITRTGSLIDSYTIDSTPPPTQNVTTLIPTGATWKYLDNGSNQGTAWQSLNFNDSSWKSGAAQLGYGDGDEATVVSYGSKANNKYITTYFRKSFTVSDPSQIAGLTLGLLRDDGAVIYLNGNEVDRDNMPAGTISYTTRASTSVEDDTYYSASISPSLLVSGTNVIAVEIHQDAPDSSDISFDFSLNATMASTTSTAPAAPTSLTAQAISPTQVQLNWIDNATNETAYKVERSTNGTDWVEIAPSLGNVTQFVDSTAAPSMTYFYRLRAYNNVGNSGYSNVASATTPAAQATSGVPIPFGATWKYLDNGSNQGTAWRATGFDDSTWKAGPAQLGYGDGDEATVVGYGSDPSHKYVTTYFRKSFTLSDPTQISALTLQLLRDDGAVVYLNGTEVYRSNMPTGTISYNTLAVEAVESDTIYTAQINPSLLVAGTNVIAVEIHQSDLYSSDISFDFELDATMTSTTTTMSTASISSTSSMTPLAPLTAQPSLATDLFNDDRQIVELM